MLMSIKAKLALLATVAVTATSFASINPIDGYSRRVTDADLVKGDPARQFDTWGSDEYIYVKGLYYVDSGCVLTIEPGCHIFGTAISSEDAIEANRQTAVIVARGGKIIADGTHDAPIVFSAMGDDPRDPCDFGPGAKGQWGGLIINGAAPISRPGGVWEMEGLPEGHHEGNWYGGTDPHDSSGVLRYVSLRHGGTTLSSANEINGLTLGGVGDRTVIEHIDIFANQDDGIEFFGGTVNTKWISAMFCLDDHFDMDEGYMGKGQYWFAVHQDYEADKCGEWDGDYDGVGGLPNSQPVISNFTFIGAGLDGTPKQEYAINVRDNFAGKLYNGVVVEVPGGAVYEESDGAGFGSGNMEMKATMFYNIASGSTWPTALTSDLDQAAMEAYFSNPANKNEIGMDPVLKGICRTKYDHGVLDPRPCPSSPVFDAAHYIAPQTIDSWFDAANYAGAFNQYELWNDWGAAAEMRILSKPILNVTQPNGVIRGAQQVEVNWMLSQPELSVTGYRVYLNDFNVTSFFEWGTRLAIKPAQVPMAPSTCYAWLNRSPRFLGTDLGSVTNWTSKNTLRVEMDVVKYDNTTLTVADTSVYYVK
jgi:hypothetical protein